jgi:hypothetical protein
LPSAASDPKDNSRRQLTCESGAYLSVNFRVTWLLFRTLLSSPSAMTVLAKGDSEG